jgi:hypothetical protein
MIPVMSLMRKMRETASQIEVATLRRDREQSLEAEQALLDLELELTLLQTEARLLVEQSGGLPCVFVGNA